MHAIHQPDTTPLGGEVFFRDDELDADGKPTLAAVNRLLAAQRQLASPAERRGGEHDKLTHIAALVRTAPDHAGKSRYFLATNTHIHETRGFNSCAESTAIIMAANQIHSSELALSDIWLMGGKATLDQPIAPGKEGTLVTPCGQCRDAIHSHSPKNAPTQVHMLPLNDGTRPLMADDGVDRPLRQMPDGMVITRTIDALIPQPERRPRFSCEEVAGDGVEQAYAWLQDADAPAHREMACEPGALAGLSELEQELMASKRLATHHAPRLQAEIQTHFMATAKALLDPAQQNLFPVKNVRMAVVRREDGRYFLGVETESAHKLSTPSAEINAIQNALSLAPGARITDLFTMELDLRPGLRAEDREKTAFKAPNGHSRERVKKAGFKPDQPVDPAIRPSPHHPPHHGLQNGAMVHVMPPVALGARKPERPSPSVQHWPNNNVLLPMPYMNLKWEERAQNPSSGHSRA